MKLVRFPSSGHTSVHHLFIIVSRCGDNMPYRKPAIKAEPPGQISDSSLSSVSSSDLVYANANGEASTALLVGREKREAVRAGPAKPKIKASVQERQSIVKSEASDDSIDAKPRKTTNTRSRRQAKAPIETAVTTTKKEMIDLSLSRQEKIRAPRETQAGSITKTVDGETKKEEPIDTPKTDNRTKTAVHVKEEGQQEQPLDKSKKSRKRKLTSVVEEEVVFDETGETPNKVKRSRKTQEEKDAEAMPLAIRTAGLRMYIGAHVSGAKGVFHWGDL